MCWNKKEVEMIVFKIITFLGMIAGGLMVIFSTKHVGGSNQSTCMAVTMAGWFSIIIFGLLTFKIW